jgi:hypothetical protein
MSNISITLYLAELEWLPVLACDKAALLSHMFQPHWTRGETLLRAVSAIIPVTIDTLTGQWLGLRLFLYISSVCLLFLLGHLAVHHAY